MPHDRIQPLRIASLALTTLVACVSFHAPHATAAEVFDLVLAGGRVIDPASGTDARLDVGIQGDRIAALSGTPLEGKQRVDVAGLVVAPGFIDLHSHTPTPMGQRLQVQDGVTTQLELEGGAYPVEDFGRLIHDAPLQNFGASVGYGSIRLEALLGVRRPHLLTDPVELKGLRGFWTALRSIFSSPTDAFTRRATPRERKRIRAMLEDGLAKNGIGIGLPLDYFSEGVDDAELRMIFNVAAEKQAPIFLHLRRGAKGDPAGLDEALGLVRATGASLHICHIQHNAMGNVEHFLREIARARAEGFDVTTEILPYNAGSALISSAVFSRDWQTIFDISYEDVEWSATGERFNQAMWEDYRARYPEGQVIHHYVKEAWTRRALVEPGVIVISDTLPLVREDIKSAPHAGTFAKVLGRYVREAKLIDLTTAVAKMTLLPAQRLEKVAPAFRRKGRIEVGADADITVFDPESVIDRASYAEPFLPSAGIPHVLVNGTFVVRDGQLVSGAAPGQRLLAAPSRKEP